MKKIITLLAFGLSATAFAGQLLVSIDEMNASNNAKQPFTAKSVAPKDAPIIELSAPKLSAPVSSPTVIEVKFHKSKTCRGLLLFGALLLSSFSSNVRAEALLQLFNVSYVELIQKMHISQY
jgi:hypothetical protein